MSFIHGIEDVNPFEFIKYLELMKWNEIPEKRKDIASYECERNDTLFQVTIPLNKKMYEYESKMLEAIKTVLAAECIEVYDLLCYIADDEDETEEYISGDNETIAFLEIKLDECRKELHETKIKLLQRDVKLQQM